MKMQSLHAQMHHEHYYQSSVRETDAFGPPLPQYSLDFKWHVGTVGALLKHVCFQKQLQERRTKVNRKESVCERKWE